MASAASNGPPSPLAGASPRAVLAAAATAAPPCAAAMSQQQALQELSTAFGSLLAELQFSFVVSCARADDNPIIYASPGFYSCTGYSPAEVLGRNCRFLQGPATSHQAVMEIRDAIREERSCSVCLLNYRKDKTPFWNYFRLEPVRAPCGMVEYFVGVQADVTRLVEAGGGAPLQAQQAAGVEAAARVAQHLAGHQAELLAANNIPKCAVLDSVPSSLLPALSKVQENFVLSDPNLPDCPIVYASQGFLRMTGYSCSEVVGRNCRFLQGPGTDPAAVEQLRAALRAVPPLPVTVTLLNYKKADGKGHQQPFFNSLHIAPLRDADGRVQFFAGVQLELSEQAAAAAEAAASSSGAAAEDGAAAAPAAAPAADALALLRQKGVVGSLRVATRALAQHGLRRAAEFQRAPSRTE